MARAFISVNNNIDIDVKSGEFVLTSEKSEMVKFSISPEFINQEGEITGSKISIKSAMPHIDDVVETLSPVLDYHGVQGFLSGNTIVINDADYLADDTVEALRTAVKGLNTYLK